MDQAISKALQFVVTVCGKADDNRVYLLYIKSDEIAKDSTDLLCGSLILQPQRMQNPTEWNEGAAGESGLKHYKGSNKLHLSILFFHEGYSIFRGKGNKRNEDRKSGFSFLSVQFNVGDSQVWIFKNGRRKSRQCFPNEP